MDEQSTNGGAAADPDDQPKALVLIAMTVPAEPGAVREAVESALRAPEAVTAAEITAKTFVPPNEVGERLARADEVSANTIEYLRKLGFTPERIGLSTVMTLPEPELERPGLIGLDGGELSSEPEDEPA